MNPSLFNIDIFHVKSNNYSVFSPKVCCDHCGKEYWLTLKLSTKCQNNTNRLWFEFHLKIHFSSSSGAFYHITMIKKLELSKNALKSGETSNMWCEEHCLYLVDVTVYCILNITIHSVKDFTCGGKHDLLMEILLFCIIRNIFDITGKCC